MTVIYGSFILIAIAIGTIYIALLPRAARRRGSGSVGTDDSNHGDSGDSGGDGGGGD